MSTGDGVQSDSPANRAVATEQYIKHGVDAEDNYHASRSADRQAAFFVPHLRPGMRLLDCGCGPGTITLGLAARVAPGEVVGIDVDESALAKARTSAAENGVGNVRFDLRNVYELPFADDSFDAAFSHALFEHLNDPVAALREILRILRPGGVAGIRTPDMSAMLKVPVEPAVEEWVNVALRLVRQGGGDMCRGKNLRPFLYEAGFASNEVFATFEVYATPDAIASQVERHAGPNANSSRWLEKGDIDEAQKKSFDEGWRRWGAQPDAFLAVPWVEGIAWKPE